MEMRGKEVRPALHDVNEGVDCDVRGGGGGGALSFAVTSTSGHRRKREYRGRKRYPDDRRGYTRTVTIPQGRYVYDEPSSRGLGLDANWD